MLNDKNSVTPKQIADEIKWQLSELQHISYTLQTDNPTLAHQIDFIIQRIGELADDQSSIIDGLQRILREHKLLKDDNDLPEIEN